MVKKLLIVLLVFVLLYVGRESYFYALTFRKLPAGTTIADVDVSELSLDDAGELVAQVYAQPVLLFNATVNENVNVSPSEMGFSIDLATMLQAAQEAQDAREWWIGLIAYLLKQPIQPITIELQATHSVDLLYEVTSIAAGMVADPPKPPRVEPESLQFLPGEDGYVVDLDATVQNVETALYRTNDRSAEIVLLYAEAPAFDLALLENVLRDQIAPYRSLIGSIFVKDLQTGEEINISGDLALSGMSIIKIAILLETYRAIDGPPNFDQQKLISETAMFSGNFSANLLLDVVAGQDNAYLGSDILSESMERLGLHNTFIVTPYEEPSRPDKVSKVTPANSVPDLPTDPDPNMQTTAEDMGSLLAMIYDCSRGGGALLALYEGQLTAEECQAILDVLALNTDGNLIRFGVPPDVIVSHKHGWATNTHGDAGVVYSDGGDYVIVTYLTEPGSDWLVADTSFPLLREMSRIVYNYFNAESPYLQTTLAETGQEAEADGTESEIEPFDFDANQLQPTPQE